MSYARSGQRNNLAELKPCAKCGMYSGYRIRRTHKSGMETYLVRCSTCGAKTKPYESKYKPAVMWNKGHVYKKGGQK